jgi:hypothetical protein
MRMNSGSFSSLWNVSKGRAAAPPGIMFIIGVSTSRKCRLHQGAQQRYVHADDDDDNDDNDD